MLGLVVIIIFVIIFDEILLKSLNWLTKSVCKKQVIIDIDLDYFGTYSS